ncbi:YkgJ family cysteine cluster protein [Andreprevotia chitinilytica]|uniref:YkgJ family cysteine cluster protein n=1 Tax=Andreprevotia chitinilytica TaxID=396808 RepID=UPI00054DEC68|nr:YkgJ family cysteine cluster protein [Andreprevotia chitinilytica]
MSEACLHCGACCASFRVSFYWAETDAAEGGAVPAELTVPVTPWRVAMRGTETAPVRCVALQGEVGQQVGCSIYAARSSTCREFTAGDERCADARARHGLPPLSAVIDDLHGVHAVLAG